MRKAIIGLFIVAFIVAGCQNTCTECEQEKAELNDEITQLNTQIQNLTIENERISEFHWYYGNALISKVQAVEAQLKGNILNEKSTFYYDEAEFFFSFGTGGGDFEKPKNLSIQAREKYQLSNQYYTETIEYLDNARQYAEDNDLMDNNIKLSKMNIELNNYMIESCKYYEQAIEEYIIDLNDGDDKYSIKGDKYIEKANEQIELYNKLLKEMELYEFELNVQKLADFK